MRAFWKLRCIQTDGAPALQIVLVRPLLPPLLRRCAIRHGPRGMEGVIVCTCQLRSVVKSGILGPVGSLILPPYATSLFFLPAADSHRLGAAGLAAGRGAGSQRRRIARWRHELWPEIRHRVRPVVSGRPASRERKAVCARPAVYESWPLNGVVGRAFMHRRLRILTTTGRRTEHEKGLRPTYLFPIKKRMFISRMVGLAVMTPDSERTRESGNRGSNPRPSLAFLPFLHLSDPFFAF